MTERHAGRQEERKEGEGRVEGWDGWQKGGREGKERREKRNRSGVKIVLLEAGILPG